MQCRNVGAAAKFGCFRPITRSSINISGWNQLKVGLNHVYNPINIPWYLLKSKKNRPYLSLLFSQRGVSTKSQGFFILNAFAWNFQHQRLKCIFINNYQHQARFLYFFIRPLKNLASEFWNLPRKIWNLVSKFLCRPHPKIRPDS